MAGGRTMSWWQKSIRHSGSVLLPPRSGLPPRPPDFAFLEADGYRLQPLASTPAARWARRLEHPQLGCAELVCLLDHPRVPAVLLEHDRRLTPEDRALILSSDTAVSVTVEGKKQNVLRDRKDLLRFMSAVMAADGVAAVDHVGQQFWTRRALDDELSHDADLDIDSIYVLHHVTGDPNQPEWLHSHGLAEIGYFDYDILEPSPDLTDGGADWLRAIAFAIVEGEVSGDTGRFALAQSETSEGIVQFVEVAEFMQRCDARYSAARSYDPEHNRQRSVLCEPETRFWRNLWPGKPQPSRFLSQPITERLVHFSSAATELMAERARKTYGRLRAIFEELHEFQLPAFVKLGYPIDGAQARPDREHLWFEVHACFDDEVDATLDNAPVHVAALREGQRGRHAIELMSDWMIMTPAGPISPRSLIALHRVRERLDEM